MLCSQYSKLVAVAVPDQSALAKWAGVTVLCTFCHGHAWFLRMVACTEAIMQDDWALLSQHSALWTSSKSAHVAVCR